ncbi:MAG: tRNA nucleotidyltransferase, partial [Candidatus Ventricola sp.]|nr:tRNA nucleotidyltransferase [Candidatus Ventricola sp.]
MNQQEMIRAIARRVQACGGRALLVGGCVRDELLGRACTDIDCEVHGVSPDALRSLLGEFGEIDESGRAYGIYTIRGAGIDIALPRTETRTGPGHKDFAVKVDPELSPAQAALRRDFTVNAIMRDAMTGEIVDPLGGMEDLAQGVLRAVPGDGFEEDPLRVLRGAQFAARFHLTPDAETLRKMRRMPLGRLSAARVYAEMNKALLTAQEPDVFFCVLRDADALKPWFAELAALIGV